MSQNRSDYKLNRTDLYEMLPAVNKNPLLQSLTEMTFNRFLTKPELQRVIGTIGLRKSARKNDQIVEDTVFDQAFQLQPVIKNDASTELKLTGYQDIIRICEDMGIDPSTVQKWQNTEQFNFCMPINLDKLINYAEYYWVGANNPEYVLVESAYVKLTAQLSQMISHFNDLSDRNEKVKQWFRILSVMPFYWAIPDQLRIDVNGIAELEQAVAKLEIVDADYALVETVAIDPSVFENMSDWALANKWVHRMDVPDLSLAKQAKMPIIEYSRTLQKTKWTYTKHNWAYRRSAGHEWEMVEQGPSSEELFGRLPIVRVDTVGDGFVVTGNHSDVFTPGFKFKIEDSVIYDFLWTVRFSTYNTSNNTTEIYVDGNVIGGQVLGNVLPFGTTSRGDEWRGLHNHWAHLGTEQPVPVTKQAVGEPYTGDRQAYVVSQDTTEFTLASPYFVGTNTLRVYVDGKRQLANYTEETPTTVLFVNPIKAGSTVEFFPRAATLAGVSREHVLVRTSITNDDSLEYRCLVEYRLEDQVKTEPNEYPAFDLVNADGTPTFTSSSIIEFAEDEANPIHKVFGKRIDFDAGSKDYTFKVTLVGDDGELKYFIDDKDGSSSVWMMDEQSTQYVPIKVDADRNPSSAADAVFEIPKQLTNNVHHEVRSKLKFSELFLHFKSIVDAQPKANSNVYGTKLNASNSYRLLENVNYGLGGTIKDYNDGFDIFVSTIVATDYAVPTIIDFAEEQYNALLVKVRELTETNLPQFLSTTDKAAQVNLVNYVADEVLLMIRNDTGLSRIFGDSTPSRSSSLKNWIATLPFFGFANRVKPEIIRDDERGFLELVHHDGHTSVGELNEVTNKNARANLIKKLGLFKDGVTLPLPDGPAGAIWYNGVQDKLMRLDVAAIAPRAPVGAPEGAYWLDTTDQVMHVLKEGIWTVSDVHLEDRWVELSISDLVLNVLLNIETRLYEAAPTAPLVVDVNAIHQSNPARAALLMKEEFEIYCKEQLLGDPYKGQFDATNAFTWNYSNVNLDNVLIPVDDTYWAPTPAQIYKKLFGTRVPNLRPWVLQGYTSRPTWWDKEYAGTTRRWSAEMWQNIALGVIPAGYVTPTGMISNGEAFATFPRTRVCVNTTDRTTVDGFGPDDLLPPYWIPSSEADNIEGIADQILLNDINALGNYSNNTFLFGDNGPNEVEWKGSVNYRYSQLKVAFKIDPIRFVNKTFGEKFITVGGKQISARTNKTVSHRDTVFHGDVGKDGVTYFFDGLNQWYVHFFRYNAMDLNGNEFKRAWTTWDTQLGYNIGSFVTDNTMSIDSSQFEITPNDYSVVVKGAKRTRDLWIDALYMSIDAVGSYREMPLGVGRDWKFTLNTRCPVPRVVEYYGIKKVRVSADAATNTFTIMNGGSLSQLGWTAGSPIVFDLGINGVLPNAIDDLTYYFVVPVTDTTFKLANSKVDAELGYGFDIGGAGAGTFYAAELSSTFSALGGNNTAVLWKHFAVNKSDVRTFVASVNITGIQNVVDFVDGYAAYLADQGFVFNDASFPEYDAATNRMLNWQYQIENAIDTLYRVAGNTITSNIRMIKKVVGEIEINPFLNNLWVDHPVGVVSEFNAINIRDANYQAIVYGRDGKKITNNNFNVLRRDSRTHVTTLQTGGGNTIDSSEITPIQNEGNTFAGMHLFFDEYSHTLLFNPYTIAQELVFDSFLGISAQLVHAYYEKQVSETKRPNVGGFVYKDGKLTQNFEYTVGNIQKYYDTFTVNENADFVNYARAMLGYSPNASYLMNTDVTPKSQFLFYKGMIKAKGTNSSIKAFTNSTHFTNAEVDEFWAFKAFEFGDSRPKESYTVKLRTDDTVLSHAKFEFTETDLNPVSMDFNRIAVTDPTRWKDYPSQVSQLPAAIQSFKMYPSVVVERPVVPSVTNIGGVVSSRLHVYHNPAETISVLYVDKTAQQKTVTHVRDTNLVTFNDFSYVMGTNTLTVYVNGQLNNSFMEVSTTSIQLIGEYVEGDVVVVIKKVGRMTEGLHYRRINNRVLEILSTGVTYVKVATFITNYATCAPVKIYDTKSESVVKDITAWDPLNSIRQPLLDQAVDLHRNYDSAVYNNTPAVKDRNLVNFWSDSEVGIVWKDNNSYAYLQYNDSTLPVSDRLVQWGQLQEWSDPAVYQWVKSTLSPAQWAARSGKDGITGMPRAEVYRRTRPMHAATFDGVTSRITVGDHKFVAGQEIVLFGDFLPSPVSPNKIYLVDHVGVNWIRISDRSGNLIKFNETSTAESFVAPASYTSDWTMVPQIVQHYEGINVDVGTQSLYTTIAAGTEYSLFLNGKFAQDGGIGANGQIAIEPEVVAEIKNNAEKYRITIVTKTGILGGVPTTRPAAQDLAQSSAQEYVDYPHTRLEQVGDDGVTEAPMYYFWVRGKVEPTKFNVTTSQLEYMIGNHDGVYMMCQKPKVNGDDKYMTQLILSGVSGVVSEDDRYVMRLIKDETLRHTAMNTSDSLLKPIYEQWIMFREKQTSNVPKQLWDKVTESILGHAINDEEVLVPSMDRVVYDTLNNTNTRFGLGRGQAFVEGSAALKTILLVLNSPEVDYTPIDVDLFLEIHDTTTDAGILSFMEDLYNSFPSEHVNRVFFAVLYDALSNIGVDYSSGLIKTSAISIEGTAPLNVNGAFDE